MTYYVYKIYGDYYMYNNISSFYYLAYLNIFKARLSPPTYEIIFSCSSDVE